MTRLNRFTEATQVRTGVVGRADDVLLYVTLILVGLGLVAVYTSSAHQALHEAGNSFSYVIRQSFAAVLGLMGMGLLSRFPFLRWKQLARPFGFLSLVLLGLTLVVGSTANGGERWLPLPMGLQFQPSDIAKVSAIVLLACICERSSLGLLRMAGLINLGMIGLMLFLILQQPNLSVTLLITAVTVVSLFVSGLPVWLYLVSGPPALLLLYHKIRGTPYQWARIVGWLHPWKNRQDIGYNLIQSYFAVGSGGLMGVGFGRSIQKLDYLPFQHTDFIFSIWCEELGFSGACVLLVLYVTLCWRGFVIAQRCPNRFGQMLAFGMTLSIVLQTTMNMAVTLGLMPVTGVTLPLVSYGGTSLVVTLCMVGMLLNISRYRGARLGSVVTG